MRSGLEKRIKTWLEESTIPFLYESESFKYITEHKYTPDFKIGNIFIEVKGRLTTADRKKLVQVRELNPDIDLRILFQRDQPIRKGSSTMYSDWATKNGFIFAIIKDEKNPQIPKEWINVKPKKSTVH